MKYAFIIGSNAFIVPHGVINYADNDGSKEVLRIQSIYHDNEPGSALAVNLDIQDTNGTIIKLYDNQLEDNNNYKVATERDSIRISRADGKEIIHIQQLDETSAMALEHNITAEFEVSSPVAVIRLFGDFKIEGLNISAENEKLFINDNGYATSAMHGTNQLTFTTDGVVL
ncbi:MAG TPA: hypothetical protein VGC01_06035 [Mucilaginibacter sp.]